MALFHYPNQLLESGEKGSWLTPILEVAVTTLQPALFALGTAYWPVKARFGRAERAEVLCVFFCCIVSIFLSGLGNFRVRLGSRK